MTNNTQPLKDFQPYMLKAFYEWLLDNNQTPQIQCEIKDNIRIPKHLMNQPSITFNLNPLAIKDLHIVEEGIYFSARFNTVSHDIFVPMENIIYMFSKEQHQLLIGRPFLHYQQLINTKLSDPAAIGLEVKVIHPKEETESVKLNNSSLYGTLGSASKQDEKESKPKPNHLRVVK